MKHYIIPQTLSLKAQLGTMLMVSNNAGLKYDDQGLDPAIAV